MLHHLLSLLLVGIAAEDLQLPTWHYLPTPLNWMNDPNGPFYDPVHGRYHLFAQYRTPRVWSHAVSDDMVHWTDLPVALDTDMPYDKGGVFTGSTTVLPNGTAVISYSVSTNNMQCLATPANYSDPNLTVWKKYTGNPIISSQKGAPNGRDDTTAWLSEDGKEWRMAYGTQEGAVVYLSTDFVTWIKAENQQGGYLRKSTTGQWECPDFFPLPNPSGSSTHVLKASTKGKDYWLVGSYNDSAVTFTPTSSQMGADPTYLLDLGTFYASKTFFDPKKNRQILYGWVHEERKVDSHGAPYGWASVMSFPRTVRLDHETSPYRLIYSPIEEIASLRDPSTHKTYPSLTVKAGSPPVKINGIEGASLELKLTIGRACGIRLRDNGKEYTDVAFDFDQHPLVFTIDTSHASANTTGHISSGGVVLPKASVDSLDVHILLDHSIIEVFVGGGRSVMTRRLYPTSVDATAVSLTSTSGSVDCTAEGVEGWSLLSARK